MSQTVYFDKFDNQEDMSKQNLPARVDNDSFEHKISFSSMRLKRMWIKIKNDWKGTDKDLDEIRKTSDNSAKLISEKSPKDIALIMTRMNETVLQNLETQKQFHLNEAKACQKAIDEITQHITFR